jgi:hypothetical protein
MTSSTGVSSSSAPSSGKSNGEGHADPPVRVSYRVELPVGEAACYGAEGVRVGVGCDERRLRERRHVTQAALVEVREVDEDSQPVALSHELSHELSPRAPQVRTSVKGGREQKGDPVGVDVRATLHEAERTEAYW